MQYLLIDKQKANSINFTNQIIKSPEKKRWTAINSIKELPINNNQYIFLKFALPEWEGVNPCLYLGHIAYGIKIFRNKTLLFELGTFSEPQYIGINNNLVPLPSVCKEDLFIIQLNPGNHSASLEDNIILGSTPQIIKDVLSRDIELIIFSLFFLLKGIVVLVLYLFYKQSKLLIGIAVFVVSNSIFIISNSVLVHLLFPVPNLYYHLDYISFVLATIGGYFAIEQVIYPKYKVYIKRIRYSHQIFLIISLLIVFTTNLIYLDLLNYFLLLLFFNMIICIVLIAKGIKYGSNENKILLGGMISFFFFASIEIIIYILGKDYGQYGYRVIMLHYGIFCFVCSLIWIAISQYKTAFREKEKSHIKELEAIRRENKLREGFARKLIETQEKERNNLGLELHDSLGQKLLLIKNMLYSDKDRVSSMIDSIGSITTEAISEIREISRNLRPQHLEELGLTTAIQTLIENVDDSSKINFTLNIDDIDDIIPKEHEINFFRIIQEGLNNILKHSQAENASVNISLQDNIVVVNIKDDGIGFRENGNLGFGLVGIKERAKMLGSELEIITNSKGGTSISLFYKNNLEQNG